MKRYILIANRQKDIEYQYADFSCENGLGEILFDFSKKRIGLLKIINMLGLCDTNINYELIFKRIFNQTISKHLDFNPNDEYVFIVMARVYEKYGNSLVRHLRTNYPSCKVVIYLSDLICNMRFAIDEARPQFDLICSFDKREAEQNNMGFVHEPFSTRYLEAGLNTVEIQYDVSFVGAAKGRYDKIMWLYNDLTNKGLKCDFYIVGVDKKNQVKAEGLHYEWLDFEKVLQHAAKSRCIVELMQPGGYSATTRYAEAVLLKKNLITDCPALYGSNEQFIFNLDDNADISAEQIRNTHPIDNKKYINLLSIKSFIVTIDKQLINNAC